MGLKLAGSKRITEEEYYFLQIKWEFMRRDPDYQKAWACVCEIRKKAGVPEDLFCADQHIYDEYILSFDSNQEWPFADKFGLTIGSGCLFNPSKKFDELSPIEQERLAVFPFGFQYIHTEPFPPKFFFDDNEETNSLTLKINFSRVKSKTKLMNELMHIVDDNLTAIKISRCETNEEVFDIIKNKYPEATAQENGALGFYACRLPEKTAEIAVKIVTRKIKLEKKEKKHKFEFKTKPDFEEILKIGDIARSILSEHPEYKNTDDTLSGRFYDAVRVASGLDKTMSTQSACETIRQKYNKYTYLVNGGWRTILYP